MSSGAMTGWERLQALPQPQRGRAYCILLRKIIDRLQEHPEVPEQTLKYMLGFSRSDLLRWYADANEDWREKDGLVR